jgi:hypothetical protein
MAVVVVVFSPPPKTLIKGHCNGNSKSFKAKDV